MSAALEQLEAALRDVQVIRYCQLASSVIIVYDHLVTIDQEFELIWNSSRSFGKMVFLANRYYALMTVIFNTYALFSPNVTDSLCLHWYRWQGWTGVIAFIFAEIILQLRLYALYFLNKKLLAFMVSFCILAAAASAGIMGYVIYHISASSNTIPGTKFCVAQNIPIGFYTFWIPMLVSESLLCALALYRGIDNIWGGGLFRTGKRLVEILIRESVFYFLVMFATYLANTIVFMLGTESEIEIPIGFAVALSCVMGNRLCLNVRGMISPMTRHDDGSEVGSLTTQERITFAPQHRVELNTSDRWELTHIELGELRTMRAERIKSR